MASVIIAINLDDALENIERGDTKKKKNVAALKTSVAAIQKHAETHGLQQKDMIRMVKICGNGNLNAALSNALIRSLIPKEDVPEEAVICAISKLCAGICSARIQELLLRWIILVFDIISTRSKLHRLYGILFNYITNDRMAPYICHLLFLLTRQQDVTHFRIASLIKHQRRVGNQPHLCGLLSVYRLYQPSLIIMSTRTKAHFKRDDKEWGNSIYRIISRYGPRMANLFLPPAKQSSASKMVSILPDPKPSTMNNVHAEMDQPISQIIMGKVHINEIKSFDDVLKTVGNLRLPKQAASLLSSKVLQHILAISPDTKLMDRLSMWLHHHLFECLIEEPKAISKSSELLKIILLYTDLFQAHLAVCESFLYRYLNTWNGHDHANVIFKLITKLPLVQFDILRDFVLKVLQKLFVLAPDTQYRCRIIDSLSDLACNYVAVEIPKYESVREAHSRQSHTGSGFVIEELNTSNITENLIKFIDGLISEGLQLEPGSTTFLFCAGGCWAAITSAIRSRECNIFVLPHFSVIYRSLFCESWACISNACSTLRNLAEICTSLDEGTFMRSVNDSRILNQYLLDFHDTLWRHRTFHPNCHKDSIAYGGLEVALVEGLTSHTEDLPVSSAFSIDKHPALMLCTAMYLETMRMETAEALSSEFVIETSYMEYLESKGLVEIVSFIKSLTSPDGK